MLGLENFIEKKVKIVFDDGNGITIKSGMFLGFDRDFLYIQGHINKEAIPKRRIIRMEL